LIDEDMASRSISGPVNFTTFIVIVIGMEFVGFAVLSAGYITKMQSYLKIAEEAIAAKSLFFATMSHQIRTPMNGILGMVDLLESSELTLDQQRTVRTVKHSSNALVRIIDDVLDLAKLEAAKLELRMEPAQLLPFLESAIDSFRSYAATKNVVLTFWYDPDLPNWVTCDVGRLRQIVLNLLSNAIKFSATDPNDPKGNVAVHIQANDMHQLVISIQDDGVGMDAKIQCHIFEPFSQAGNVSTLNYGGTVWGCQSFTICWPTCRAKSM
jgi:signal transduction histidine kinase